MDLYERIKLVAKEKEISINSLEKELGFARSSISKFKTNIPSIDKIMMIANRLGVSADYLMTGEKPDISNETYYLNDDAKEMAQFLFENPDYKALFDASRKVKKEDIQFVREMIDRLSNND